MITETYEAPYPPVDGTQPCATEDPELFFPTTSREIYFSSDWAKQACAACPFRRPCLAYALTHDVHGIWGGTSRAQREDLRREHHITAAPVAVSDQALTALDIDAMERGGASATAISRALGVTSRTVVRHRASRRQHPPPGGAHP